MRPSISVIVPTYEPTEMLRQTLLSVLHQDPGASVMQIAIVDDASPTVRPAALLSQWGLSERIELYQAQENLGLAGNWNRAIAVASGEFIHLLHQDDTVALGFYDRLVRGLQSSDSVGMAFARHAFIDDFGQTSRISHRERWRPGVLGNWLERIGESQRLQCPAALLRRNVYETIGGFRSDLKYALDWEMWVRVATRYAVWYEPRVLAFYRRHRRNETSRLQATGELGADLLKAVEICAQHFPPAQRDELRQRAYRRLARSHLKRSMKMLQERLKEPARAEMDVARDALAHLPDTLATRACRRKLARLERQVA